PLGVDAPDGDLCARRDEHAPRAEVVRLFEEHAIAGIEERPRDQVERLLRARGDDDLFRLADDAARPCEMLGDRDAELDFTFRRTVIEIRRRRAPRGSREESPPERLREVRERGPAVAEVPLEIARAPGPVRAHARRAPREA